MRFSLAALCFALVCASMVRAQIPVPEPVRDWKTTEGAVFKASVQGFDGTTVTFRMPTGARVQAAVGKLGEEDQRWLAEWLKRQPIRVVMPDVVGVEAAEVKAEVVSEDAGAEKFVYRTQNFEFESQGKFAGSLLKEVGRDFEATRKLLIALPWGIGPKPESGAYFRARILKSKEAYHAAGGPVNSGGVYMGGKDLFMVPFESIGVKAVGKSYRKDEDFRSHTLVHELTHQMMHSWLGMLPQWIIEGTAEYTAILPMKSGRFRVSGAKGGLKDYMEHLKKETRDGVPEPYALEKLFAITNEEWNQTLQGDPRNAARLYFTSYLLVYYFMHLEGKGDGQLFVRYFREMGDVRAELEKYRVAVEAFKKQPGVEVAADGRSYRWPSSMKHPEKPAVLATPAALAEFQKKTLYILRGGNSEADLMKQIRSAYAKLAIRI